MRRPAGASRHFRSRLAKVLAPGLAVGLAALFTAACGGGTNLRLPPATARGAVYSLTEDSPSCDILALRPTFGRMILFRQGGGSATLFNSSSSVLVSIKVDYAALRDFSTILNLAGIPEGLYSVASITLTSAQIALFDPTRTPPVRVLNARLNPAISVVKIQPPLQIVSGKVSVLHLNFDLARSVVLDASGQVTSNVTPTFEITPVSPIISGELAALDDLTGFIERVDSTSASPKFIGDFQMQLLGGTGPSVPIRLSSATQLFGAPSLLKVPTGSVVEIDGSIDPTGNVVADAVEVEDRADLANNKLAFIGNVLSVSQDISGNLTQFSMHVHEEEPDSGFVVPLDSVVTVNVTPSTTYQFSSRLANFAGLTFGPASIVPGEQLVVHGKFTVSPTLPPPGVSPPTTVAADSVYLKMQSFQGVFTPPLQAAIDDMTGAFNLATCSSMLQFQGAPIPILVITTGPIQVMQQNFQTGFVNLVGLSGLTNQSSLLVKGMPFFQPKATTINGVSVPAGTLVVLAKQVHQLP